MNPTVRRVAGDWYISHHPGRQQPWTLKRTLRFKSGRYLGYETWRFCETLQQAQRHLAALEDA